MSARPHAPTDGPKQARVLEISELPVSQVRGYAADAGNVYFERRGDRTFLVADR
jgi:hypothetical protein